jgi:protein SCO1
MRDALRLNPRSLFLIAAFASGICLSVWLAGCSSPKPAQQAPSRYALRGRVLSIDKAKPQVVVDNEEIPGFMMAMTMPYAVKDPSLLNSLSSGDQITADVVVNGGDVWLENIVVVKKTDKGNTPASNESRPSPAAPGKQ